MPLISCHLLKFPAETQGLIIAELWGDQVALLSTRLLPTISRVPWNFRNHGDQEN